MFPAAAAAGAARFVGTVFRTIPNPVGGGTTTVAWVVGSVLAALAGAPVGLLGSVADVLGACACTTAATSRVRTTSTDRILPFSDKPKERTPIRDVVAKVRRKVFTWVLSS